MEKIFLIFMVISLLTGGVYYLMWEGLKSSRSKVQPEYVVACVAILGVYCVFVCSLASSEGLGLVFAFSCSIPVVFGAIVSTFIIAVEAPRKRKFIPIVLSIAFAAALYVTYLSGMYASPEAETKRNGVAIATAIEVHFNESGCYPVSLEELIPEFLQAIPPIAVTDRRGLGGTDYWYYQRFEDGYALGYLESGQAMIQDRTCAITSANCEWICYSVWDQDNPFMP